MSSILPLSALESDRVPSQLENMGGKYMQSTAKGSKLSNGICNVPLVFDSAGIGWLPENGSELNGAGPVRKDHKCAVQCTVKGG